MNKKEFIISDLGEIENEMLEIEMKFFERYGRHDNYTQKIRKIRIKINNLIKEITDGGIEE
jgi:hypothetical protein